MSTDDRQSCEDLVRQGEAPEGAPELAESLPFAHVARVCLRLGVKAVRANPTLLLGEKLVKRGPKPKKK